MSPDQIFSDIESLIKEAAREKLLMAEKNVAWLRFVVATINTFIYLVFMERVVAIDWLAAITIAAVWIYVPYVLIYHPYRKYQVLLTSYFTSVSDAILITLWIIATGGYQSQFYLLWFVSIIAIALRYSFKVTLRVAFFYIVIYLMLLLLSEPNVFAENVPELSVRVSYIIIVAILAGYLSDATLEQIKSRIIVKKSEEEIRERENILQKAHDELEEKIRERTQELSRSNELLRQEVRERETAEDRQAELIRKLDRTNRDLIRTNEEIDNFIYVASHDLKSPVANIEALVSLLEETEGEQNTEAVELREKMRTSLLRMRSTIDKLSKVAKAQKEVYDDVGEIIFDNILKEVISDNEQIIKKSGARIVSNFKNAPSIKRSHTVIKSILYNLITNAIKYQAPGKTPLIEISSRLIDDTLELTVKDNGLGMDLIRHREKVFALFKRLHDHVEGAGIGLYMVKKFVENSNGKIEVESEPGEGTTFRILFTLEEEKKS